MGTKIRLWRIKENELSDVEAGTLPYEKDIHDRLETDLSLISDDILIIGSHVRTDYGTELDILGMEPNGDLVVIELKRDKTDEQVTAQALDYASWVSDLSYDEVIDIAREHYGSEDGFQEEFKKKFDMDDIPETFNQSYRMIIVGSALDEKTERVVNFLSQEYGVPINAVLFEYFKDEEGEFLAKTALIEEEVAKKRVKSKRAPSLTDEDIDKIVEERGIKALYGKALEKATEVFGDKYKRYTVSSVSFDWPIEVDGKRRKRAVLLVFPKLSSREKGLKINVYIRRVAEFFDVDRKEWAKRFNAEESEAGGTYRFYLKSEDEITEFFGSLVPKA